MPSSTLPHPDTTAAVKLPRGWQHLVALGVMPVAGPVLIAQSVDAAEVAVLTVYVLSIAALFGVSAAFHLINVVARAPGGSCAAPTTRRSSWPSPAPTPRWWFLCPRRVATHPDAVPPSGWAPWAGSPCASSGSTPPSGRWPSPTWWSGWSALAVVPQLLHSLGGRRLHAAPDRLGLAYTAGAAVYAARVTQPGARGSTATTRSSTLVHDPGGDPALRRDRLLRPPALRLTPPRLPVAPAPDA